jgi:hypothetical protein
MGWDWVYLALRPLFGLLYQPRLIDDYVCEAVDWMRIGRRNWSIRRKPTPVPLCPPQIPHDVAWARTRTAAVGNRPLTAWVMARSKFICKYLFVNWLRKVSKGFSQVKRPRPGLEPGMSHIPRRSALHWTMTQTCGTAFPGSSPAVQIWSLFRLRFDCWDWETYRQTWEMGVWCRCKKY